MATSDRKVLCSGEVSEASSSEVSERQKQRKPELALRG